jgi:hypothetical protein
MSGEFVAAASLTELTQELMAAARTLPGSPGASQR